MQTVERSMLCHCSRAIVHSIWQSLCLALILLVLALHLSSTRVSAVFTVLHIFFKILKETFFNLPISELSLVGLALDLVVLTVVLQFCDTVGRVI